MNLTLCMLLLNRDRQKDVATAFQNESISTEIVQAEGNILSDRTYVGISIFMFLLTLSGVIENGAVIYVFLVKEKLRNTTNTLVVFLSVCNFLISTLAIPFVGASALAKTWLFGHMGCEFHGFIVTGLGLTQICVLVVISIDRYVIIVKSSSNKKGKVNCYVALVAGCVFYGFLCAAFPLFGWNTYTLEVANLSCAIDWTNRTAKSASYCVFLLVFALFIPMIVIITAYINIIRKIKQQRVSFLNSRSNEKKRLLKREHKVASTVLILIGAFLLSWLPYSVFSIASLAGETDSVPVIVASIPSFTAKFSVVWNPIIYIYRNRKYRAALIETFPFLLLCSNRRFIERRAGSYINDLGSVELKDDLCDSLRQTNSKVSETKQTEFPLTQVSYSQKDYTPNSCIRHSVLRPSKSI